jgi:hypothetical protein
LRFHVGPGGDIELPVQTDYSHQFPASDHGAWLAEYRANVDFREIVPPAQSESRAIHDPFDDDWLYGWEPRFEEEADFMNRKEQSRAV